MMDGYGFLGGLVLALGVLMSATFAHRWRPHLDAERISIFEAANRHHMFHGLCLVLLGLAAPASALFVAAGMAYLVGLILFSGTLYHRSLSDARTLSRLAPLGGLAFITGHVLLALGFLVRLFRAT